VFAVISALLYDLPPEASLTDALFQGSLKRRHELFDDTRMAACDQTAINVNVGQPLAVIDQDAAGVPDIADEVVRARNLLSSKQIGSCTKQPQAVADGADRKTPGVHLDHGLSG